MININILSQVNFDSYQAIISFVNIGNIHWKFLVSRWIIPVYTLRMSGIVLNLFH